MKCHMLGCFFFNAMNKTIVPTLILRYETFYTLSGVDSIQKDHANANSILLRTIELLHHFCIDLKDQVILTFFYKYFESDKNSTLHLAGR
jgi:hypothetical protein